jgi:tetratricopeptide (TPR) repeat protein
MSPVPDEALSLKNSARTDRNLADLEGQPEEVRKDKLNEAARSLKKAVKMLEDAIPTSSGAALEKVQDELADCLGMTGGIYRRLKLYPDALQFYERGLYYEKPRRKNTYNLSNVIAHRLILKPQLLHELQPMILEGLELLAEQQANRDGEWWFHADRGLFNLLCGEFDRAIECYEAFKKRGPGPKDYKSTMDVLAELQNSLEEEGDEVANLISDAIEYLPKPPKA